MFDHLDYSERHRDFRCRRCIKVEEIKRAISKMGRGKATGPDEISVEFWKSTDMASMVGLFNVIFKTTKMPEE